MQLWVGRIHFTADQPLEMDFSFDNPQPRKAFSFHLLGYGLGAVEVSDFSVITELLEAPEALEESQVDKVAKSSQGAMHNWD